MIDDFETNIRKIEDVDDFLESLYYDENIIKYANQGDFRRLGLKCKYIVGILNDMKSEYIKRLK